jgi:hypothetical protein
LFGSEAVHAFTMHYRLRIGRTLNKNPQKIIQGN